MSHFQPEFFPCRSLRSGLILIVLLTCLAYFPVTRAGYTWDDAEYVTHNPKVLEADGLAGIWLEPTSAIYYYPTTFSTFWLGCRIWGLNPLGYHLLNLGIHILNACMLVWVLRSLRAPGAILAGLIFALHPVQASTVAWITELKNLLSQLFFLLSFLSWWWGRNRFGLLYLIAVLLFILGMLAKPIICSMPISLLLIIWWKSEPGWGRQALSTTPFFLISIGISLFTVFWVETLRIAVDPLYELSLHEKVLLTGQTLWFYLGKLLWPYPLLAVYPKWDIDSRPLFDHLFPLAHATLLFFLWRFRRNAGKGPLVAFLFIALSLGPVLGFFKFSGIVLSYVFTHHLYHAAAGFAALVGGMVVTSAGRIGGFNLRWALVFVAGLLATYGILTWNQAGLYENERVMFEYNVAIRPDCPQARVFLGNNLMGQGDYHGAVEQFRKAIDSSPLDPQSHFGLAEAFTKTGKPDLALEHFKKAVEGGPTYSAARYNLAWAYLNRGDNAKAIEHFSELTRFRPDYWSAYLPLAEALLKQGKETEAIGTIEAALRVRPDYVEAEYRLATLYLERGELEDSVSRFEDALRIDPDRGFRLKPRFAGELVKRARRFREKGQLDKATQALSEAKRIWPRLSALRDERKELEKKGDTTPVLR